MNCTGCGNMLADGVKFCPVCGTKAEDAEAVVVEATPTVSVSLQGTPVQSAPVQSAPMQSAQMQTAPAQSASVQGTPVQSAPVQGTPAQGTPAQGAPAQNMNAGVAAAGAAAGVGAAGAAGVVGAGAPEPPAAYTASDQGAYEQPQYAVGQLANTQQQYANTQQQYANTQQQYGQAPSGEPQYAQATTYPQYQQPTYAPETSNTTLALVAFIFSIISTVATGFLIIPLCWCIPMTVHTYKIYKGEKSSTVAFGVCMLLFVNLISGILLLVDCSKAKDW